jgi:serine/threonine protein kinase
MAIKAQTGAVIDGFTLHEELYRGGMAVIWRVTHPDHPGRLLMKMPLILDGDDPGMIVSFETELMMMPRLSGPQAPRTYAVGDFATTPHIVMEHVEGRTIEQIIEAGPIGFEEAARIGAEVAKALHALHGQNVIHLDLKPANIMIRPDGRAVLIDFGLSRHADLPDLLAEESTLPIGTGAFIAPEQVLGQRTEPRSDLFALGVILYLMATGKYPFGQPGGGSALRERLWRDPVPPRVHNPAIPPWGQEIILRCLSVDPAARHATAAQLSYDLRHPEGVTLTDRADRAETDSWLTVMRRRYRAPKRLPPNPVAARPPDAPIVAVAVDLSDEQAALSEEVRRVLGRILAIAPTSRLVCLNVFKTARLGVDVMVTDDGESLHVRRLVGLRHWASTLPIPQERVSHHILEAPDPAQAILSFIRLNQVDHLVMGARSSSQFRRYLGSVSSEVVSEAPCSVTIVRLAQRALDEEAEAA